MRTHEWLAEELKERELATDVELNDDGAPGEDVWVIFFSLRTDNTENRLENFQPETSSIVVMDNEVVEFDIRLGSWTTDDRDGEIQQIRDSARRITRKHYVPVGRIDSGERHQFMPHIRLTHGEAHPELLVKFLEELVTEIEFLKNTAH